MSRTAHIVWMCIGIGVAIGLLIAAVVWGYQMRPISAPCTSVEFIIEDRAERLYVTEAELQQLLRSEDISPVGKQMDLVSLHRIEQAVIRHPMVRKAECYLTPRNEVKVRLTQRVPLLRVQVPGNVFFIDTDRKVMQARASVRDSVLVVTGTVGVQAASGQLADFAEWLNGNRYWKKRIHHIHAQSPQMVYLYLRDEKGKAKNERIVLGAMRGYERKLDKLRTFIEKGTEATEGKQYTELDLRFKGQVVGRY